MTTHAFVFARGGSKGLPGKNIRPLNGKPLIEYAIEVAQSIPEIHTVFVSTDCKHIADVAIRKGAVIISRPKELATDESPEWDSWRHAIRWVTERYGDFSTFLSLPATSPLRNRYDVEQCLKQLDDNTDCVVGIVESKVSPWFNMVQVQSNGYLATVCEGTRLFSRRQDAPKTFDLTTVAYVARNEFVLTHKALFDGRIRGVLIPAKRAVDIDTLEDFEFAEHLLSSAQSTCDESR